MPSPLIQFRLTEAEAKALEEQRQEGESLNLCAQRVMKQALSGKVSTPVNNIVNAVDKQEVEAIVDERFNLLQERLQKVEQSLGESAA